MIIIDVKGLESPESLEQIKQAFADLEAGAQFVILLDNEAAVQEVHKFLQENNVLVEIEKEDEIYKITACKDKDEETSSGNDHGQKPLGSQVYLIRNNVANNGLKLDMINQFLRAVPHLNPIPGKIIFIEQGVNLVLEDSICLDRLKKIEAVNVTILVNSNATDYYGFTDKVAVGELVEYTQILNTLNAASKVICI